MEYKSIYLEAFNDTIEEINSEIISQIMAANERNKNFTTLFNQIKDNLTEREVNLKITLLKDHLDLLEKFQRRFVNYESEHLTCFIQFDVAEYLEIYPKETLVSCLKELGQFEGISRANLNFSNSYEFLETAYVLNKNYEHFNLNFDPNKNPKNSELFYQMQKERFPVSNLATWEETVVNEFSQEKSEKEVKPEKHKREGDLLAPGDILEPNEKLYLLHILKLLTEQGSNLKTTEFLRILHLSASIIDYETDLSDSLPNYRKVNDGWVNLPKNERIRKIENIIAKLNKFKLPIVKDTLNQKLKSELRRR